ncbi:MAG: MBOAT family protein [Muribaculaceae bacterium]|nr:MBOAT family protein [Muribaculaceae bacterium]
MLFNSFQFLIFLPVVFALYWFVFRGRRLQNALLVVASYIFYGWWDWRFLGLIALTSLCSYVSGLLIERFEGRRGYQKLVSGTNIVLNLLILCYFKYFGFFTENLNLLLQSTFGYRLDWVTTEVILPVGISFYTFQALSYSIDVYRRKVPATHDVVEFFAYISFFPQLVAGPIERATNLLPQFQRERSFDYCKAVDGLRQMLWGFVKKLLIADNVAITVNLYWGQYKDLSGPSLLVLMVLFAVQIYCDFSGYSDIAIGCGRLFGFNLMRNFKNPFFARNIPEVWRRWHISLMSWFRDYVYIPLGGSRHGQVRMILNLIIVYGLSGLWHGANWTFICWGLLYAVLLPIYNAFGVNQKYSDAVTGSRFLPSLREFLQMMLTFLLFIVGSTIFRSESMPQAIGFLSRMFTSLYDFSAPIIGKSDLMLCIAFLYCEWLQRDKQHALQIDGYRIFRHASARYLLYALLLIILCLFSGQVQTFIYFQF